MKTGRWCLPIILVLAVAACSSSAATPTNSAPNPGGGASGASQALSSNSGSGSSAALTPTATPTPTPTPTTKPTPTPTPAPIKANAPTNAAYDIPCLIDYSCPASSFPVTVTWSAPAGSVSGYRLYYTTGTYDFCLAKWTATGSAKLIKTLGATTHRWKGSLSATKTSGKYSVVAYNAGGASKAAFTGPVLIAHDFVCG